MQAATRRDRRLHRLGLCGRSRLAELPRLQVRTRRLRGGGRAELSAARGQRRAGVRRGVAGRARRTCCSTTRSPSTSRAATWRSPSKRCSRVGGFEPIFAAAGDDVDLCWRLQNKGLRDRLQPRRHGLALPPQHGARLPEATARLRQSGGVALFQASLSLQHARPIALARAHLRRPHGVDLLAPADHLLRAPSAAGSSRRCTSRRRRCSRTCRSRSSGTLASLFLLIAALARRQVPLARARAARDHARIVAGERHARQHRPALHDNWRGRCWWRVLIFLGPLLRSYERYLWRIEGLTDVERDPLRRADAGAAHPLAGARVPAALLERA